MSASPTVLVIGSFPAPEVAESVFGGNRTDCQALMDSIFGEEFGIITIDSTQRSVPPPSLPVRFAFSATRLARLLMLLIRSSPDCALIFASSGLSLVEKSLMAACCRLANTPVILCPRHGGLMEECRRSRIKMEAVRLLFRIPDRIVAQSASWQEFLVSSIRRTREDCPIVENWTATPNLLAIGAERVYKSGIPLPVGFLGRLSREKGVLTLVHAVAELQGSGVDVDVKLAGKGAVGQEVRALGSKYGLSSSITALGWVEGEAKRQYLEWMEVYVLPSESEGVPNSMVEAMAAGAVPVVSNVGGIPDVIDNARNGLLIEPGSVGDIVRAVRGLAKSSDRERLGRAAHETARARFTQETGGRAFCRIVQSLMSDAEPPSA